MFTKVNLLREFEKLECIKRNTLIEITGALETFLIVFIYYVIAHMHRLYNFSSLGVCSFSYSQVKC